ncbi:hypothetical protein NDA16_003939 [Ustilago loliicola]|nr:hypothetical protein NDA16_003939 [Ustilago loliicola]
MHDREFTMAKSLLTVLSGRSRNTNATDGSSNKKASSSSNTTAAQSSRPSRHHRFDDKSGPPPPRGSLTSEKLSYLDWRLKRINHVRQKSEASSLCWIDGRDTIGRTSFDVRPSQTEREQEERIVALPAARAPKALHAVPMMPSSMAAIYADEKAAGIKALEHAFASDSVLASMPYLAKRDSSSGSEMSGSSDQHASHAPGVLHATADKDVGGVYFTKPRKSFLTRAGTRFSKKRGSQASSVASKLEVAAQDSTDSRPASRGNRSLARIWNR